MAIQYPVITISREYGSYGRTIAKALSEQLGVPYYDHDFVKETAKQSGYSEEDITKEGESLSTGSRILNKILNNTTAYTSSHDAIFQAQREVILKLAESPCIIVGRCANHILQEAGVNSFDIFLYADMEFRKERAHQLLVEDGIDPETIAIEKLVNKVDNGRAVYYKQYTGQELGYYKNYNICLDVGTVGVEQSIQMLVDILKA